MSAPADPTPTEHKSLSEAVQAYVALRMSTESPATPFEAPDGQIWGTIASLMGLSRTERQERQQEILDAFLPAWIAAGGKPRTTSPKKARADKRKKTIKQIKTRRAKVAKIVAANQRTPIAPKPDPSPQNRP